VSCVDKSHKGKYIGLTLLRFSVLETTSSEQQSGNLLTRSKPFKAIVKAAFKVCDNDQTGEVGKLELYAGLLWVHLNLAKYAGPAACYVRFVLLAKLSNEMLASYIKYISVSVPLLLYLPHISSFIIFFFFFL
jgi:hypothetical protein